MSTRIERVMPLLLREEKNKNDYIPKVVSIGPYHHGKPELASVEAFKPQAVNLFVLGGTQNMGFYYSELLGSIDQIRQCYEENPTVHYSDNELARLMLYDACFIIIHMETFVPGTALPANDLTRLKNVTMWRNLGSLTMSTVQRDFFLLENQIPLGVIKFLMDKRYETGVYEDLLHRYLNFSLFGEYRLQEGETESERPEPLHLVEAFRRLVISDFKKTGSYGGYKSRRLCCFKVKQQPHDPAAGSISRYWLCCPRSKCFDIESGDTPATTTSTAEGMTILGLLLRTLGCKKAAKNPKNEKVIHSFRSVTDLKAKGIFFQPSPTRSLMDVDFKPHFFCATVQLPYWYVSRYTRVFFLNMIAYEMSPNSPTHWEMTSYINFMNSLMERAEDVKELRDKKILYNQLGSDHEVLTVYKDINACTENPEVFGELKDKIQAHYQSRTKTWMAELIHTYFRTPWTVIAFLGAISLLAISAAQLQYAVHPN